MEEVIAASDASDDDIKRLIGDFKRAKNILKEARDKIENGFKELNKERDTLAAKDGECDTDESEILNINSGGGIISVTRDTLTQIKGTRLEDLFCGRWEKRLLRDGDGRIFLDVNPACFRAVVDYLTERKITPPGNTLRKPHVGKENDIVLQQLLLAFGLGGDGSVNSKKSVKKSKVRENKAVNDTHSRATQDKWRNMKIKMFPMVKPYDIQTVLKK